MLYSVDQILAEPKRVFFAVGFETTTPMTVRLLEKGVVVFAAHKIIPPAMKILAKQMNLDGFINPGHVSTIIGAKIWEELELGVPQVISGFKPTQLVKATYILLKLIKEKKNEVINDYPEVVLPEGNQLAKQLIARHMKVVDSQWRGMGTLPKSGLVPLNPKLDARIIYQDMFKNIESVENKDCICGEIVRGYKEPRDCKLYGKECTIDNPIGACMVSDSEGACAISYKYGKSLAEV